MTPGFKRYAQRVLSRTAAREVGHEHTDKQGLVHLCYHKCKSTLFSWGFWVGTTFGFPLEHYLWEKVPGFSSITHWLGL